MYDEFLSGVPVVKQNDPRFAILKPKRNWRLDPIDLPLPKFIVKINKLKTEIISNEFYFFL